MAVLYICDIYIHIYLNNIHIVTNLCVLVDELNVFFLTAGNQFSASVHEIMSMQMYRAHFLRHGTSQSRFSTDKNYLCHNVQTNFLFQTKATDKQPLLRLYCARYSASAGALHRRFCCCIRVRIHF